MVAVVDKKTKTTNKKESSITINLCDGNKGGVGKSFLCRALYHWFLNKFDNVCGLESDINSPDFLGIYGEEITLIKFSENEEELDLPNLIFQVACEDKKHTIINLPATAHDAFLLWDKAYGSIDLARDNGANFIKWFVTTGEFDSIKSLEVSLKTLGDRIPHVVVKNQKYSDWDYFDSQTELQDLIKAKGCPVIELPKLPVRIASFILQKRLKLSDALTYKADRALGESYGIAEKAAVTNFLKRSGAQFDKAWEELS
jgi:hypothetical protein